MRWSELSERELIDIYTGERLGRLGQADMVVDEDTGKITHLVVQQPGGLWSTLGSSTENSIPWQSIKQVGPRIVLIESRRGFSSRDLGLDDRDRPV